MVKEVIDGSSGFVGLDYPTRLASCWIVKSYKTG